MSSNSDIAKIPYNVLNKTLSSDRKFKRFFKKVENLAPFLSEILSTNITPEMIEYLDSENLSHGQKGLRFDIFVSIHFENEDKYLFINLEMQKKYYSDLDLRMENYLHVAKSVRLKIGKNYKKICMYGIWLMPHSCAKRLGVVEYLEEYGLVNPRNINNRIGKDGIILIDLNLMLNCAKIELRELAKLFLTENLNDEDFSSSKGKAWYEEMIEINKDDLLRFEQEKDLMKLQEALDIEEQMKAESRAEGKAEGLEEGKFNIARNMLRKGVDINFISECTGLTIEEVKKLNI